MDLDPSTPTAERRPADRARSKRSAPKPPAGEWLFERAGEVFGPISGARLVALLDDGTIDGSTRVRHDGVPWCTVESTTELLPHLRAARTRARLAEEARRSERRARWSATARWTAWTLLIGGTVVLVAAAAAYLSAKRPWHERSALLADFGEGVRVSDPRIVGPRQERDREIAVPDLRPTVARSGAAPIRASSERARGAATAPALAPGSPSRAASDALVAAQFDQERIEKTVGASRERLAGCVRDEARRSPEFSGPIPIEFAIANDGKVGELWIDEPRFRTGPLRECLLGVLRSASFTPFSGQRPIVSLAFQVGGR